MSLNLKGACITDYHTNNNNHTDNNNNKNNILDINQNNNNNSRSHHHNHHSPSLNLISIAYDNLGFIYHHLFNVITLKSGLLTPLLISSSSSTTTNTSSPKIKSILNQSIYRNNNNNIFVNNNNNSSASSSKSTMESNSSSSSSNNNNNYSSSQPLDSGNQTPPIPTTQQSSDATHKHNHHQHSGSPPKQHHVKDERPISLPNQSSPIKHFALDIGGTLSKLVYFVQNNSHNNNNNNNTSTSTIPSSSTTTQNELGGKLHFIKFQTKNIEDCLNFIIDNKLHLEDGKPKDVRVTGGGAYKYADLFNEKLGCRLIKEDEMHCLIVGTNFLLNNIQRESYTYSPTPNAITPREFVDKVVLQIGSGVSVIKVDSETSFQRVDGTSLGGGTFWGLCSLLTGVTDFDEMLEMTKNGHSNNVDLVVGDIYGTDYSKIGLSSETIASSFGKIIYQSSTEQSSDSSDGNNNNKQQFRKEDIAQSLLKMVSNNIGQIAYLNSQRYGLNKIYFGGFFIRDHPNTMQRISFAIDFWSKGKTKAMFLVHDGYLGALGAFLAPNEVAAAPSSPSLSSSSNSTPTTTSSTITTSTTNNNTTNSTTTKNAHDDDIICDCGCEFCEGLVCKVDLKIDNDTPTTSTK
ncbi:pantothenate kinase [Heterostelium album PN500]|uniref:pantothenate kinase n=1 Tax=Heterostelium pallidum (strain ATCC 26659 / Pp 5 / PN500) TaxID=670386 RepID=D3B567_HETP5|nr:pantothenate kinase [Heterostelium album PN500]EFA83432.1 pantothenate kinase [Heterostelium album PN500]|eukprot:XP_020435549.1 pantothenate kinase [Heterostelium album PN500]